MSDPTSRQMEVLGFMRMYQVANSMPPTLREIADAFGWASMNSALCHLRMLRTKGLVKHHPKLSRGWVALEGQP
jgi:repressor LexA